MPSEATPRLGLPFLAAGQAQKEVTHNEALALADAAICPAVQALGLDAPPASPTPGQCWIVGAAPTGAWTGQAQALAIWTSGGWRFVPAIEGMQVWLLPERVWAVRDGGIWRLGELRANQLILGGQRVVGARQPAVVGPAGGTVVDAEARAAINAILARMSAHGLISS
jgi:hypothetical protein